MSTPRTYVFYINQHRAADTQPIRLPGGGVVYIRVEAHDGTVGEALDDAQCRRGESVMNSHAFGERE